MSKLIDSKKMLDLFDANLGHYIIQQTELLRSGLANHAANPIDYSLKAIPPFIGNEEIKLIIVGQDPTIRNVASRKKISCTLNLDKNNSLKTYISSICEKLGITLENVYATNLFKYFYTYPPAETPEVLRAHLEPNLELLKQELESFKGIPVIILGQPLLQLLCGKQALVRNYWGYLKSTGKSNSNFSYSQVKENKLSRDFFPFPHQPSIGKEFYKNTLEQYCNYLKYTLLLR